jgi:hypothetical protein
MMLHQESCPHCSRKNIYFDSTLKLNQQIEDDVTKILDQIQNQLGLQNQAKEDQKVIEEENQEEDKKYK